VSQPYQSINNDDRILPLAQRLVSATTVKEFATVISEAYLILNKQEWNGFMAECWRLKHEAQPGESSDEQKNGSTFPSYL
jgi:hypothetical protein